MAGKLWAHYDGETGEILGLYNEKTHGNEKRVPYPHIEITEEERNEIVKRSDSFRVIGKVIEDLGIGLEEMRVAPTQDKRRQFAEYIACGALHNDHYFYADDEAVTNISFALALSSIGQDKFLLKAKKDKVSFVSVDVKDLKEIAKKVYSLRKNATTSIYM